MTKYTAATYDFTGANGLKEGDTDELQFVVGSNFSLTGRNVRLNIRDENGTLVIPEKTSETSAVDISDQTVTVTFTADELRGKSGSYTHEWEAYATGFNATILTGVIEISKDNCYV